MHVANFAKDQQILMREYIFVVKKTSSLIFPVKIIYEDVRQYKDEGVFNFKIKFNSTCKFTKLIYRGKLKCVKKEDTPLHLLIYFDNSA